VIRETVWVDAGDVQLAVYLSGPRDGPPIVLVHGYPDSATVWEPIRAQLDRRFRVIAYDVRGAGVSDAPATRNGYRLQQLAADLAAVADATCGGQLFHLVGHDWGSIQCWEAATEPRFKGRIASYTSISGPCLDHASLRKSGPAAVGDEQEMPNQPTRVAWRQMLRSWYIVFFHLPWLPELVWRLGGARLWPLWLRMSERVGAPRDPEQLRNAINGLELYRANIIDKLLRPRARHAHAPVQFIVPLRDRYVGPELSLGQQRWLGAYERIELDAGHWAVLSVPDVIAAHIERFALRHHHQLHDADASPLDAQQCSTLARQAGK